MPDAALQSGTARETTVSPDATELSREQTRITFLVAVLFAALGIELLRQLIDRRNARDNWTATGLSETAKQSQSKNRLKPASGTS
jgi:hypothetical protein